MRSISIDFLGNHQEYIEEVADIWTNEWSQDRDFRTPEEKIARFKSRLSTKQPPFILLAFEGDVLVGTAALLLTDLDSRKDIGPWLGGVLVKKKYRGSGVASMLIGSVVEEAKALGFKKLYLHTETAQGLYEKLGWTYLEHTINDHNEESDIYFLDI